ncbi:MAG: hypothetical protein ACRD6N_08020, partial [Pyrinomonadaceae bacterium]
NTLKESLVMKTFAFVTVILISSFASLFSQAEKKQEFFAGFSFETVNTGITSSDLTPTIRLDICFKVNGFHLSVADYFPKHFGIVADLSAHFDNRTDSFGATTGEFKFSLYNFRGGPQVRFPNMSRFTPFAHVLAGIVRRNLTEKRANSSTSYTDNNTSFAMNFGGVDHKLSDRFARWPQLRSTLCIHRQLKLEPTLTVVRKRDEEWRGEGLMNARRLTMERQLFLDDIDSLPAQAQHQVTELVALLKQRLQL